jgi:Tol biopolymer transport system component
MNNTGHATGSSRQKKANPAIITLFLLLVFPTALLLSRHVQAGSGEKILFVEKRENNRQHLVLINPDGTGKKQVSKGYFYIVAPHCSQENSAILFTFHNEAMKSSVHVLYPEASLEKIIEGASAHCWSPDGTSILFSPSGKECDLYRYNVTTKGKERLTRGKMVIHACWSPEGKRIAFSAMEADGNMDLYLFTVQSASIEKLTRTARESEHSPVFTPDGKALIYCHQPFNGLAGCAPGWLEKIEIQTKKVTPLPVKDASSPSLSSDGQWIVFEDGSGTDGIGICKIDGSSRRKLPVQGSSPVWMK